MKLEMMSRISLYLCKSRATLHLFIIAGSWPVVIFLHSDRFALCGSVSLATLRANFIWADGRPCTILAQTAAASWWTILKSLPWTQERDCALGAHCFVQVVLNHLYSSCDNLSQCSGVRCESLFCYGVGVKFHMLLLLFHHQALSDFMVTPASLDVIRRFSLLSTCACTCMMHDCLPQIIKQL